MGLLDDLGQRASSPEPARDATGQAPETTGKAPDLLDHLDTGAKTPSQPPPPSLLDTLDPESAQQTGWLQDFAQRHPYVIHALGSIMPIPMSPLAQGLVSAGASTFAHALRAVPELGTTEPDGNYVTVPFAKAAEVARDVSTLSAPPEGSATGKVGEIVGGTMPYFLPYAGWPLMALVGWDASYNAAIEGGATPEQARVGAIPGFVANTAIEFAKLSGFGKAADALSAVQETGLQAALKWGTVLAKRATKTGLYGVIQQAIENETRNWYDPATDTFDVAAATRGMAEKFGMDFLAGAIFPVGMALGHPVEPRQAAQDRFKSPETAPPGPTPAPEVSVTEPAPEQPTVGSLVEGLLPAGTQQEIIEGVMRTAEHVRQLSTGYGDWFDHIRSEWMMDETQRLRSLKHQSADLLADMMQAHNDDVRVLIGRIQEPINAELDLVGGRKGPLPAGTKQAKIGKAQRQLYADLMHVEPGVGSNGRWGSTRLVEGVESQSAFEAMAPDVKERVLAWRRLSRMMADVAVEYGMTIPVDVPDPANPGQMKTIRRPFKGHPLGMRWPRAFSPDYWRILEQGPAGPHWKNLVDMYEAENGMTHEAVLRKLDAIRMIPLERRSPFEVVRQFPKMATHLGNGRGGWIELYGSDPFSMAHGMLGPQVSRLSFSRFFGQEGEMTQAFMDAALKEGGPISVRAFERAFRIMNGMPLDIDSTFGPGTPGENAARFTRMLLSIQRAGMLTNAWAMNLPETLVSVPHQVGYKLYVKALVNAFKDPHTVSAAGDTITRNMAQLQSVVNHNWDPKRGYESFARKWGNFALFPFTKANLNSELIHSQATVEWAKKMLDGGGELRDRMLLERLGFKDWQVNQMMDGSAPHDLYVAAMGRMVARGISGANTTTETSPLAKNKIYNNLIFFDSYARKITAGFADLTTDLSRAMVDIMGSPYYAKKFGHLGNRFAKTSQGDEWQRLGIAAGNMAKFLGGAGVAGTIGTILLGFMRDGIVGAVARTEDMYYDLGGFALDTMANVLTAGMVTTVSDVVSGREELGNALGDMPGIIKTVGEIYTVLHGTGQYSNYEGLDRWSHFLDRNLAAATAVRSWAAVMGLGARDKELEIALRRFYTWKRKNTIMTRTLMEAPSGSDADTKRWINTQKHFRAEMKQVEFAIRHGEKSEQVQARLEKMFASFQPEDKYNAITPKQISQSLMGRKVMDQIPKELLPKFAEEFPEDSFQKLLRYDGMLDYWAHQVSPRKQ